MATGGRRQNGEQLGANQNVRNIGVTSPGFGVCYGEYFMSKKVVMFEFEKETKNSVRYKEVPDAGTAPVVGTLYVQKWFAGDSRSIEITIDKKD